MILSSVVYKSFINKKKCIAFLFLQTVSNIFTYAFMKVILANDELAGLANFFFKILNPHQIR